MNNVSDIVSIYCVMLSMIYAITKEEFSAEPASEKSGNPGMGNFYIVTGESLLQKYFKSFFFRFIQKKLFQNGIAGSSTLVKKGYYLLQG